MTVTIAAVGDSTTLNGYPSKLQTYLGSGYIVSNYGVGHTGIQHTIQYAYQNTTQYQQMLAAAADIYIVQFGTNDGDPANWTEGVSQNRYVADYMAMLERIKAANPNVRIIMMTSYHANPNSIGLDADAITRINVTISALAKQVAKAEDLQIIDMNTLTAGHPEWFIDGIHPTETLNTIVANYLKTVVEGTAIVATCKALACLDSNDCFSAFGSGTTGQVIVQTATGPAWGNPTEIVLTDAGNYFLTDTVEAALQQLAAQQSAISGLNCEYIQDCLSPAMDTAFGLGYNDAGNIFFFSGETLPSSASPLSAGASFIVANGGGSNYHGERASVYDVGQLVGQYATCLGCSVPGASIIIYGATGVQVSSNGANTTGVTLPIGSNAWVAISAEALKGNFIKIDPMGILKKLAAIPIQIYQFKDEAEGYYDTLHIGPTAEAWNDQFSDLLGEKKATLNGKEIPGISEGDKIGVALASIQALTSLVKNLQSEIEELKTRLL